MAIPIPSSVFATSTKLGFAVIKNHGPIYYTDGATYDVAENSSADGSTNQLGVFKSTNDTPTNRLAGTVTFTPLDTAHAPSASAITAFYPQSGGDIITFAYIVFGGPNNGNVGIATFNLATGLYTVISELGPTPGSNFSGLNFAVFPVGSDFVVIFLDGSISSSVSVTLARLSGGTWTTFLAGAASAYQKILGAALDGSGHVHIVREYAPSSTYTIAANSFSGGVVSGDTVIANPEGNSVNCGGFINPGIYLSGTDEIKFGIIVNQQTGYVLTGTPSSAPTWSFSAPWFSFSFGGVESPFLAYSDPTKIYLLARTEYDDPSFNEHTQIVYSLNGTGARVLWDSAVAPAPGTSDENDVFFTGATVTADTIGVDLGLNATFPIIGDFCGAAFYLAAPPAGLPGCVIWIAVGAGGPNEASVFSQATGAFITDPLNPDGSFQTRAVCFDDEGNAWIANSNIFTADKFDAQTGFFLGSFPASTHSPTDICFEPTTRTIWVAGGTDLITKLALDGTVLGTFSTPGFGTAKAIRPDGLGNLWVCDQSSDAVYKFSAASGALLITTATGNPEGDGICWEPVSGTVWVSNSNKTATQLDSSGAVLQTVTLTAFDNAAHQNNACADGVGNVWVALFDGSVDRIGPTGTVTNFPIAGSDFATAIASDGTYVWVTDGGNDLITKLLISTGATVQQWSTTDGGADGANPLGIAVSCSNIPLTLACPVNHTATVGTPYTGTLIALGGIPPYTFAIVSGSLPPGLSLNTSTGVISGTPTASGNFTYGARVTDAHGATASVTCTITSVNPLSLACPLSVTTIGQPYSQTPIVSGGVTPYVLWSIIAGSLPLGLMLNMSTGLISGTPTTLGTYSYTIQVTDSVGATAQATCQIIVGGVEDCSIQQFKPQQFAAI